MRVHKGEEGALPLLVKSVFGPLHSHVADSWCGEGIVSGELIDVDWLQIPLAALGANVFYFLSAPVWRLVMARSSRSLRKCCARGRVALVEFLGQAIFNDRQRGAEIARACWPIRPCRRQTPPSKI